MSDSDTTCESCGDASVAVTSIRRLYVTPPAWDTEGSVREAEVEMWCYSCRTMYPHHELDGSGARIDHEFSWPVES